MLQVSAEVGTVVVGAGVVVVGAGVVGAGVVGEHTCSLSGQQSPYWEQASSHQQPAAAFPPQLP